MIRKEGRYFVVRSHTLGRSFGKYLSKKKAEKRLAQIKMFSKLKKVNK